MAIFGAIAICATAVVGGLGVAAATIGTTVVAGPAAGVAVAVTGAHGVAAATAYVAIVTIPI